MLRSLVRPDTATERQPVNPDDYLEWTEQATQAIPVGLREAVEQAARDQQTADQLADARLVSQARDYVDLNEAVDNSVGLLDALEAFLATFQRDLSAVSGHISELQSRSKNIDARLHTRKSLESHLSPLVAQLVIPPELIDLIMDTQPSEAWLTPITHLEAKLSAIRSGPRVPARKSLDDAADKLRIKAADKIRLFFIDIFKPYRTSITPNLQNLQSNELTTLRPLFAFLQRHAPRQAHEVQKSYVAAATWYYETGFRRYTRALEKVKWSSSAEAANPTSSEDQSLGALFQRNFSALNLSGAGGSADAANQPSQSGSAASNQATLQAVTFSALDGPPVIVASQTDDPNLHASPEALFRSISMVLADNAASEFAFLTTFFGRPEDLPLLPSDYSDVSSSLTRTWDSAEDVSAAAMPDSETSSVNDDTLSAGTMTASDIHSTAMSRQRSAQHPKERAARRSAAEHVWKQVMEGPLEYCKSFIHSILSRPLPATSILSMIRLNGAIMHKLLIAECPSSLMESYLMGIKLDLWPLFQKQVGQQVDSVRKLTGAASSESQGLWGKSGLKDSVVSAVVKKYISLFNSVTQLTTEEDEDMVFASIGRLRSELEKLIEAQARKMTDKSQASAYKASLYDEVIGGIMAGIPSHPRTQKELAHFRELSRLA